MLRQAVQRASGVSYQVKDPERFAVASFNERGKDIGIEEKSQCVKSHYTVTGLYLFDKEV